MSEQDIIDLLEQLPDGTYITKNGRVAQIKDGEVVEMVPKSPQVTPNLGTGGDDPTL